MVIIDPNIAITYLQCSQFTFFWYSSVCHLILEPIIFKSCDWLKNGRHKKLLFQSWTKSWCFLEKVEFTFEFSLFFQKGYHTFSFQKKIKSGYCFKFGVFQDLEDFFLYGKFCFKIYLFDLLGKWLFRGTAANLACSHGSLHCTSLKFLPHLLIKRLQWSLQGRITQAFERIYT